MPHTLNDEVPPTVRDEAQRPSSGAREAPAEAQEAPAEAPLATLPDIEVEPAPVASRSPRRSRRAAIAIALLASLATLVGIVLALWLGVLRYEPHARRHVPGNAGLVARVELADLALFAPVREHFGPRFAQDDPETKRRAARIREATGVNLATDVREILVATVDGADWVVLAGGRIARGRVVHGLAQVAREEGWPGDFHEEGELLIGFGGHAVLAQADDGTLIAGTDAALVRAALPASDDLDWPELRGASGLSFLVTKHALGAAGDRLPGSKGAVLGRVARAAGRLSLGRSPELELKLAPAAGADAATVARDLDLLLADLRLGLIASPDRAGEKAALEAARVTADGDQVRLVAPWPYEGLDRACAELAARLPGGN